MHVMMCRWCETHYECIALLNEGQNWGMTSVNYIFYINLGQIHLNCHNLMKLVNHSKRNNRKSNKNEQNNITIYKEDSLDE